MILPDFDDFKKHFQEFINYKLSPNVKLTTSLFSDDNSLSVLEYEYNNSKFYISYYNNYFTLGDNYDLSILKHVIKINFNDLIELDNLTPEELFQYETITKTEELFAIKVHSYIKQFIMVLENVKQ